MQSPFCGQSGLFIVWLSSGMPPSSSGGDYLCKKLEEIEIVEAKDESGRQSSGTITLIPSFSLCLLFCFCTFTSFVLCCSFFFSLLYELHSSTNRPCSSLSAFPLLIVPVPVPAFIITLEEKSMLTKSLIIIFYMLRLLTFHENYCLFDCLFVCLVLQMYTLVLLPRSV